MNLKEKLSNPIFSIIERLSKKDNVPVYVVGGYVRDIFLMRNSKDIDIVVVGSGINFAQQIVSSIKSTSKLKIFKNFGTAMFIYKDSEIEFVGARRESYNRNSRNPIIEDGTLNDDQKRRDFTINALAISLSNNDYGELIDPFDGIGDMEKKIIRTPLDPDITFSDDPLRMMRAIRFASQLNFTIDSDCLKSICKNAERINIVSKERIIDEFNKIMLSDKPSYGISLLSETKLLDYFLPQLGKLKGVEIVDKKGHKDNFLHTLLVVDKVSEKTNNLWLRWAALLHDIAKPLSKKFENGIGWTFHGHEFTGSKILPSIFKQLRLPLNEKMKYVQKLIQLHHRPIILSENEVTDSAIRRLLFDAGDEIEDLLLLCEADITSKNNWKVKKYLNNLNIVRKKLTEIEEKDHLRNFQPPISGEIIMKTYNIEPGREIGIIKNKIKDAILNGDINNNYEDAYNLMLILAKDLGLKPNN